MRVILKPYELELAAGVGVRRHINGMAKGMVHTGGFNGINGFDKIAYELLTIMIWERLPPFSNFDRKKFISKFVNNN